MGFGDQSGSKLSTAKTYLVDAQGHGAEIVAGAHAERVLVEDGRAAGMEALWRDPDETGNGTPARVVVRAPVVVVACGAVCSPALLLRSGIGGPSSSEPMRASSSGSRKRAGVVTGAGATAAGFSSTVLLRLGHID
jgi:choline dehydrogenase-like flavoprotein